MAMTPTRMMYSVIPAPRWSRMRPRSVLDFETLVFAGTGALVWVVIVIFPRIVGSVRELLDGSGNRTEQKASDEVETVDQRQANDHEPQRPGDGNGPDQHRIL